MARILKWQLDLDRRLALASDVDIVAVGEQGGEVTLWGRVSDTRTYSEEDLRSPEGPAFRYYRIVGTGHTFAEDAEHVGTVQVGAFVWHVIRDAH